MSAADTTLLTRQREMLLQKLDEFERTNKALRRLLREQQATEVLQGNLILYSSRWGFSSHRRCCILRLLFSVCWLFLSSSFWLWSRCRRLFMTVAKCSSLSLFTLFSPFFCSFRLRAVCSSSSPGTGQVKPGFSDWRKNSGENHRCRIQIVIH